ncbi:ABC transporter permease [Wenjunlia tyrosinilytica]|uniref:ABC transmembrane type-2 domain-containing protein n=1 Tax=Wenjunlia tyrosinilytica TaxID=1544741 RepID=A0A918E2L8_9ACTN|nr:ABC transporter permease [Wenjunlia tyrosinilytica]GGP00687.1 hypothetical protein GCM10012280_69980 [Wenjunlia tyrosinilytica]
MSIEHTDQSTATAGASPQEDESPRPGTAPQSGKPGPGKTESGEAGSGKAESGKTGPGKEGPGRAETKAGSEKGGKGSDRRIGAERLSAFRELSRAMILISVRDKATVFFLVVFPVMFLLLFGTLFKDGATAHAKVAQVGAVQLLDSVHGADRAQLDKVLSITRTRDEAEALRKVRKGDLDALIEQGKGNTLVLRFSGSDQVKSASVKGIFNSLLQQANLAATGKPATYTLKSSRIEDQSLKPIQFLTPGLLGWAIATGAVFSSSLTLVTMRRKRVLRRLRMAPISAGSVVASRIGVTMIIALVQTVLFISVASTPYFGLELTGNWWLIVPLVICATIAFMSIGLLTGSLAKTEEAANGFSQLIVLPMSFLSGSFFSLDDAPGWLKAVSQAMPLRYLVTGSESVLTRGGGILDVLPTMGGMLLFAAVLATISWRFFSWDDA